VSDRPFDGKRLLVTGGTGSLGQLLVRRLLSGEMGDPERIVVFSRDEAKQHQMRLDFLHKAASTDEIVFSNFQRQLSFRIGDVRDFSAVVAALREADVVFSAAAMKQVPACEYFPIEAVQTNVAGPENLVRAIEQMDLPIEAVVGVSTDKACKPVNVMGMTKALQERVLIQANMRAPQTRFVCVRYGNVLASRGSVIPLFHDQIRHGGPVTITTEEMTRFLLSLDDSVELILAAVRGAERGEIFIPRIPSARVADIASVLIGDRPIETKVIGIRPGEKVHEVLISEEEAARTITRGGYYAIQPMLPELRGRTEATSSGLSGEYSSGDGVQSLEATADLLRAHRLMVEDVTTEQGEMLR
jgi:FlaA1/EpsC-like NDP-sugar epimerase